MREQRLEAMIRLTETAQCRTRTLLACFGENLDQDCGHCDVCASPVALFDGTVAAQKVLSAIYRTGQMFGALHITAVLRGQRTPMTDKHDHDKLSTWGLGADQPEGYWRGVIRQLLAQGALRRGDGERAGLALVPERARPILRGEQVVMLRDDPAPAPLPARSRARPGRADRRCAAPGAFEALRTWRMAEAKAQAVPPYVIFHDSVLRDIAVVQPRSLDVLGQIKGVGASKLDRYGAAVLRTLQEAP